MDAAEQDVDAKLYKASGTLLKEISHKLPALVHRHNSSHPRLRLRVLDTKCAELRLLLDRFQEWPQLIDPFLNTWVRLLADAFVEYLANSRQHYGSSRILGSASASPLPRAICRLLYTFCKVRGYKVIVRLLNNEPRHLEPMLSGFQAWNQSSSGMVWEERYVMLLWLSHSMLAPFELADMSLGEPEPARRGTSIPLDDLPGIARDVVPLAFDQLSSSGKEQQAASTLLVRLVLRKDMQNHELPAKIIQHVVRQLLFDETLVEVSPYRALGLLTLIYGILNAGSDGEVAPFLEQLFHCAFKIANSESSQHIAARNFAPVRKLVVKILRVILTHAISLSRGGLVITEDVLNLMLEESIQHFLDALGDKDAPVRMASAKALSMIALRLDDSMSTEVIEAVLGSLQENVLLEDPRTQKLVPLTSRISSESSGMKRNISAVDPLKWHGLMLTLGHFLFRRSPPAAMLDNIIHALVLGLEFEQRSNVGTSVGIGVRDAACFGLWAVARKYSTSELASVEMKTYSEADTLGFSKDHGILQLLACKLAVSACSDPSGNIRRGSSAALQELIGRHPDTIMNGIAVVQTVDYHAVARLSRAMLEVSPQTAALDNLYHQALFQAATHWRGARAVDAEQRRWAASNVRLLSKDFVLEDQMRLVHAIQTQLLNLKPLNVGSTAGARHGLLLALASMIDTIAELNPAHGLPAFWAVDKSSFELGKLTGKIDGRVSGDIELIIEGVSVLIATISRCIPSDFDLERQSWIASAWAILSHCTGSSRKELVVSATSHASFQIFRHLPQDQSDTILKGWLDPSQQSPSLYTSRGRIRALSLVYGHLEQSGVSASLQPQIIIYLTEIIRGSYMIETRVDAMEGLTTVLAGMTFRTPEESRLISDTLTIGLTDYTNDQRGDVGSTLRLQSLEAVDSLHNNATTHGTGNHALETVMPIVVKLAAEKLNNVRFRAWKCLRAYLATAPLLAATEEFEYLTEVSTVTYYRSLLQLLPVDWARESLTLGLISSATAGTEDICRAACNAFVEYLQGTPQDTRQSLIRQISALVLEHLETRIQEEDRAVLPLLEFTCFLIDQGMFSEELLAPFGPFEILSTLGKLQPPTSSLPRLEALINLYSRLLGVFPDHSSEQVQCLDKLTRRLLHRWPRVRNLAADVLYLHSPSEELACCNWNGTVATTKPVVLQIRKSLGATGKTAAKE